MKTKAIFLSLVLLLGGLSLKAQSPFNFGEKQTKQKAVSVSLGVGAGANMSGLVGVTTSDPSMRGMKIGFNAGAIFQLRFLPRNNRSGAEQGILAIQPEVRISNQGGKDGSQQLGLTYLSIPVMIQVYPTAGLYLEVGPVVNINVAHSPDDITLDGKGYNLTGLKANDFMVAAGIGYLFDFGLGIGVRYNHGLMPLDPNLPMRNYCIQAGLSYLLRLGKKPAAERSFDF